MEYLNQLEPLLRMFWFVAIPVSIIFVIQTIMTFLGTDAHNGDTPDFNGDLGNVQDIEETFISYYSIDYALLISQQVTI
jgi:hypothetical protein